eukprot:c11298_g1_i1 orf=2-211(-)
MEVGTKAPICTHYSSLCGLCRVPEKIDLQFVNFCAKLAEISGREDSHSISRFADCNNIVSFCTEKAPHT